MKAIVDVDEGVLIAIEARLHEVLLTSGELYNATNYAGCFMHPTLPKCALIVKENEPYYTIIMDELTSDEKTKIETLGSDWWEIVE